MPRQRISENQENDLEAGGAIQPTEAPSTGPTSGEEVKPEVPQAPRPLDQIVYYNRYGGKAAVAWVDSISGSDGMTVNLIALVYTESPPAVKQDFVPYSKAGKPGSWNWGN
jgi:uncharacterized protein YfaP (DUF2135 family)